MSQGVRPSSGYWGLTLASSVLFLQAWSLGQGISFSKKVPSFQDIRIKQQGLTCLDTMDLLHEPPIPSAVF